LDKHKKLAATVLLRAVGLGTDEQILHAFYDTETIKVDDAKRTPWSAGVSGRRGPEISAKSI